MVSITSLWLPIFLSAVFVFIASSIFHMVLPFHRRDVRKTPREDELQAAMRGFSIPPGDYAIPCAGSPADMKNPAFVEKLAKGPIVYMTVAPAGRASMGTALVQWFIYTIVVGIFAAYITGRALGPGAPYLQVHRFAGATAFIGYSLALAQPSIWYKRSWRTTLLSMFDGLIYGLLTGGTFGWLWPR
jgi:hypothetical protein